MKMFQTFLTIIASFVLSACVVVGGTTDNNDSDNRQAGDGTQVEDHQSAGATSQTNDGKGEVTEQETTVTETVLLPSALITRVKPEPKMITLSASDNFATDSSILSAKGKAELDRVTVNLALANIEKIAVVGHTDSVGSDSYNQALSMRRANSVKNYLVNKGVPSQIITVDGQGEMMPVASNQTAQGRAANRRVEISFETKQQ